jgi:hypothetical protein
MAERACLVKLIESFQVVNNKGWHRIQSFNLNLPIKTRLSKLDYAYLGCKVDRLQIFSKLISESV